MLVLINTNRMVPPIAPIGLDYIAGAVRKAACEVEILDLCFSQNVETTLANYFSCRNPELVGLTLRNVDDCFWPSAQSFVPDLVKILETLRPLTDAPRVLGGVGFSIFAERLVEHCGVEFGIRGDGEEALVSLLRELRGQKQFERVGGLIWRQNGRLRHNPPAWPRKLALPTARNAVDNPAYFRLGGQGGIETKRGCPRSCIYCAELLAKGSAARTREPAEVAEEAERLLAQGVDALHLCDSEFNIPYEHAQAVCAEFIRRRLGERLRWYTYMAIIPFDESLAENMRRAGCVGINFTADSASLTMLKRYRQAHRPEDVANAARLCRRNGIAVMFDLLLGGPGETPLTLTETISFMKSTGADCVGAALGLRVYPQTAAAEIIAAEGPIEANPAIRRKYGGPVDFIQPTFYVSTALGERPAEMVKELIAGDERFFEPTSEFPATETAEANYNYNDNTRLAEAIASGARGAYWDILRRLRTKG